MIEHRIGPCRSEVYDKLNDLSKRNVLFPPHSLANGSQRVVVVHENVNERISDNEDPLANHVGRHVNVKERDDDAMVVNMEKI